MEGQRGGLFWRGLLAGVGLATVALVAVAATVVQRGVEVTVPTRVITARLEREVEAALLRELPAALSQVRAELPRQVAAEAGRRLAETRIDLGGFVVPVPPAAVQQVEQVLSQALRVGVEVAVRRVDTDGLARRLGDRAASLADEQLRAFLAAQSIALEVAPGLKVPVRLIPR